MFDNLLSEEVIAIITDLSKIVIPSAFTYFITKFQLNNPHKRAIKEKQFQLVYLPLYLLTQQYLAHGAYNTHLNLFIKKAEKIIYKNYPLVFPKTLKLFSQLKELSCAKEISIYKFAGFVEQIYFDYWNLKRALGYPTDSFWDSIKRLNKMNKLCIFIIMLCVLALIYFVMATVYFFISGNFVNAFFSFLGSMLFGLLSHLFLTAFR